MRICQAQLRCTTRIAPIIAAAFGPALRPVRSEEVRAANPAPPDHASAAVLRGADCRADFPPAARWASPAESPAARRGFEKIVLSHRGLSVSTVHVSDMKTNFSTSPRSRESEIFKWGNDRRKTMFRCGQRGRGGFRLLTAGREATEIGGENLPGDFRCRSPTGAS